MTVRPHAALTCTLAAILAVGSGGPFAVSQEPSRVEPPVFGVQAAAVVVDVVVRDRRGRLVRDLTPAEFEIYEDGARQTADSFRVVDNRDPAAEAADEATAAAAPAPGSPAPPAPAPATAKPGSAPSVIAFVFDRLTPEARRIALNAAMAYTERGHVSGDLVAVFSIDLALRTLQPFTNDLEAVRSGLQQAAAQANTQFASDREQARQHQDAVNRADLTLAGAQPGSSTAAVVAAQQAAEQMQLDILRAFDAMERDQQGFATTHGLMAVVNGLKAIPGRKTVVFFSEGIALPTNVQAQFRSVIAAANRANVSVYAMDAAGLRVQSGTRETRDELVRGSQQRLRQEESGGRTVGFRDSGMLRQLERNEDMLRLTPEGGLGQLAEETGGFLVRDTNDASSGFSRIVEDMRFHYVLSYSPTNGKLDGQYRTISVKVRRPDLRVQTRKGYFAVRPEYILPVRGYEAPALAQLDLSPRPNAFPLGVAALSFPETERPGLVPVLVAVPGSAMAWAPERGSGFRADFTVVVRINDARGREADRLSQNYSLAAPAERLEAARRGEILFYREANLPAGRYTAEAVAYDAIARTASVRMAVVEVPGAARDELRLSSLVVVTRAEKLTPAEQKEGKNPLHFGEAIVYPNMGAPLKKSAMPAVGFYFTVYGGNADAVRRATIEVHQGSRVLARTTSELPAADAQGRIQHAGALPLSSFPPGAYTMKVSVGDGPSVQSRTAAFTVTE